MALEPVAPDQAAEAPRAPVDPGEHVRLVRHVVSAFTPPPWLDREDLVQEGCVALCRAARRYDPAVAAFTSYAAACVRGAVLKALTWAREHHLGQVSPDDRGEDPLTNLATAAPQARPDLEELGHLLAVLTPRQREAIGLRFGLGGVEGLTFADVGRRLGVSGAAAKQLVNKGLERMRRAADRRGDRGDGGRARVVGQAPAARDRPRPARPPGATPAP